MIKYYTFTFYMWLLLALLSVIVAVWKYLEIGDDAWWFFVACGAAVFLCIRRFVALKKARAAEKNGTAIKI